MTDEEAQLGLTAWGVPVFTGRMTPPPPRPEPTELLRACLQSENSRYKDAAIPLFRCLPESESRIAIQRLRAELSGRPARWLRWTALAAEFLGRMYRSDISLLRGPPSRVPTEDLDRGSLPAADEMYGQWGFDQLSEEIGAVEGDLIDWKGSLEDSVTGWTNELWAERGTDLADLTKMLGRVTIVRSRSPAPPS